jgi:hypothetical protein
MEAALWVCVHRDLDAIPDNRVVGVAVHLLLEESQRRATTTAAANVTQLVRGPGALLPLPNPQYLRRIVGGTECDQGRSEIYLKNWLPHGASPQQASMARRYVRDNGIPVAPFASVALNLMTQLSYGPVYQFVAQRLIRLVWRNEWGRGQCL